MPKVDFTPQELNLIAQSVNREVASASRAQKSGKSPEIIEVYKVLEGHLKALEAKCITYANTKQPQ